MFIKQASRDHFSALRTIELASFETLRDAHAVSGEPSASSEEELQKYLDHGLLYGVFDEKDVPVGYGGGYVTEGWLHIGEIDVHPSWQQKGLGRRLMETMLSEGRSRKLKGATLTTDRFAPFNAPFYESLGFQLIERDKCSPRLQFVLHSEVEKGADPLRRVGMALMF
ncbi:GNAT family N-acetyltransferase [Rhizobium yanglingense]